MTSLKIASVVTLVLALSALAAEPPAPPLTADGWKTWTSERDNKIKTGPFSFVSASDVVFATEPMTLYLAAGVPGDKQKLLKQKPAKVALTIVYDGEKAWAIDQDGKKSDLVSKEKTDAKLETPYGVNLRASRSERDHRAAFRLFDPKHPAKVGFAGLPYFPFNSKGIVHAKFVYDPQPKIIEFETVQSLITKIFKVGHVEFVFDGKPVVLDAYADESDPTKAKELSFFLKDQTTGKETYSGGRYLDIDVTQPLNQLGEVTLDLNRAYNPLCARSKYWNCVRVPGKPLAIALNAGEKAPAGGH